MTLMIAETQGNTNLGVGFVPLRNRPRDEAWRRTIGTKQVPARLALLPEPEKRWDRLGLSAIIQISLLIFFVAMPIFFPERLKTSLTYQVNALLMPVTEVPVAPPLPPPRLRPKAPPTPKPEVVEAKLNPKQPHIFVQQKAFQHEIRKLDVNAPELKAAFQEAKLDTQTNQPKRPKEEVKVDNLSSGSAAVPTVTMALNKVQTGGFGDPNGLPGPGNPNKTPNINRQGSPALPAGPGYGNGTGGAKGVRGTVASTGFGNGVAVPPPSGGKHGGLQSAGFSDQSVAREEPRKKAASSDSPTTPVDILDKPRPEYTAEGRKLRLEGDIVLDVVFLANGTLVVNRVANGLGHGLDEAAIRAAQQIRFKPAKRDGQPVDFPARVRIEFRLAY